MIYSFDSTMPGALQLSGTNGSLAAILKAYLGTGTGAGPVATLTVAAGKATATYGSGHPFKPGAVAQFTGATPAALNGLKVVLTATGNSITFAAPGVPDGPATGTITSKLAPAGWTELYPGTPNVLALKPSVLEATGCVLRVDDTGTTTARIVGYESLADINTGIGAYPTQLQMAGGLFWAKSEAASAAARPWKLFADEQAFILWVASHSSSPNHGILFGWGDFVSYKSGDAYGSFITGGTAAGIITTGSGGIAGDLCFGNATYNDGLYVPRAYTAIGSAQVGRKVSAYNTGAYYSGLSGYSNQAMPYPNPADNSLRIGRVEVAIGTTGVRGAIPGVFHTPQIVAESFMTGDLVQGGGEFAGRTLMALRCGGPSASIGSAGCAFVDITGPWR